MPGLPYSNGGMVDPFANAMQGGLWTMYGIQDAQAKGRDQDQDFYSNLNKYNNDLLDNPVKEAERENKLSKYAVEKDLYDSGLVAQVAQAKAKGDIAENEGKVDKAYMGPMMERAASDTTRFVDDMKAIEEAGGGELEKQAYWQKNVAPVLQKMKAPSLDYNPQRLERLNKHFVEQTSQWKKEELLRQQGENRVLQEQIRNEGRVQAMQSKLDKPRSTDQVIASIMEKLSEGKDITPSEQRLLDFWAMKTTATTANAEAKNMALQNLQVSQTQAIKKAMAEKDPVKKDEYLKQADLLSKSIQELQNNVSPATREPVVTPTTPKPKQPEAKKEKKIAKKGVSPSTGDTWVEYEDGTRENLGKQ